jgi:hypothetical protein
MNEPWKTLMKSDSDVKSLVCMKTGAIGLALVLFDVVNL